jgi:uncharacterized protein
VNQKSVLEKTANFVRQTLGQDCSGHDWHHARRVRDLALSLAKTEKADVFVVELACLLHDIADYKFHPGDDSLGPKVVGLWLKKIGLDKKTAGHVAEIVRDLSFKGAGVKTPMKTLEGKIVQEIGRASCRERV